MLATLLNGFDPIDVVFLGVLLAVGLVKFVLWLIRPPRWQDLDRGGPPVNNYQEPWLWW